MILVLCVQLPDLTCRPYSLPADYRQVNQKETRCADWIVAGLLHNYESEVCLVKNGNLLRQVEHSSVDCDKPIPVLEVV